MSVSSLHLPIAMATRPQLGSAPCTAVLTSGELRIALATRLAWSRSRAPVTSTVSSLVAPSPSRASCRVRSRHTAVSAARSSSSATSPAVPLANAIAVSEVEVSVSTDRQLKVSSTAALNAASSTSGSTAASVKITAIIVAMSGSTIPTPLATPTTWAVDPVVVVISRTAVLGWVSVVIMAAATARASEPNSAPASPSRWVRSRSMGYWRPITPVEAMSRSSGGTPTDAAARSSTSRALAMPCSPVATLAFLATTTRPRARPEAALARLRTTEGPAKRDRVKTADEAGAGPSLTTTTTSSPSSRRPAEPAWARKPAGRGTVAGEVGGCAVMRSIVPRGPGGRWRRVMRTPITQISWFVTYITDVQVWGANQRR